MGEQFAAAAQEKQAIAALQALGALESEDAAVFTTHERSGEAEAFERVVSMLGAGVTPVAPPARLRERLLARLQSQTTPALSRQPLSPHDSVSIQPWIVRAQAGQWQDGPAPGLSCKLLFHDVIQQRATQLLRIAPGAVVPPHQHADAEELYIVEGSCVFHGETFAVGDYIRMTAGSVHDLVTSEHGCVLLVQGSTRSLTHS